ncbi:MAG TPA: DUF1328 family protein [bacterium]|nr:DUF1328 family protein [bacterium]
MLHWVLILFLSAVLSAVLGLTGIAAGAAYVAKILFVVFSLLFLISLLFPAFRRPAG